MRPFWKAKPAKTVEESLKYKIRADPMDHSFTIESHTHVKKSIMMDFYKKTAPLMGAKTQYDQIGIESFFLPEKGLGILHGNLRKFYAHVEAETKKDFAAKGKVFRFSVVTTKSCEFVKLADDDFDIVVKTEGYWINS